MNSSNTYRDCILNDAQVAGMDPLGANEFFSKDFSRLSEQGECGQIVAWVLLVLQGLRLPSDSLSAQAITRDLGMIAAALTRWQEAIPAQLELALLALARVTGEVPADTVFSYGPRNPKLNRRRFTTLREEELFIQAFAQGMEQLYLAVAAVDAVATGECDVDRQRILLEKATRSFQAMTRAIVEVKKNISPECFTHQLRPFFEPKTIGGVKYFAPGGAQMPVILLDQALWGAGHTNPELQIYWADNLQYLPLSLRNRFAVIAATEPLCLRYIHRKTGLPTSKACLALFNGLISFRYPHHGVAKANFAIRPSAAQGSGGYTGGILQTLVDETVKARDELKESIGGGE